MRRYRVRRSFSADGVVQTMAQFHNFKRFIDKVDKYGMKSGIVKVIPPAEWYARLWRSGLRAIS